MKKITIIICIMMCALFGVQANNYTDLKSALKAVLPEGQAVYKVKVKLNAAQAKEMNRIGEGDFLSGDEFVLYYTKTADNKADTVAVQILEILLKYQAMHDWVIGLKPDGTRTGLAVIELTDHYSYPLAEKRFLDRFQSRSGEKDCNDVTSIDVVAGATESSMLLRYSVKRVLYLIKLAGLQ